MTASTESRRPRSRRIRFCVLLTVGLYVASVGMRAIMRAATNWIDALTVSEMLYDPALTVASTWIIYGIISALMSTKEDEKT